MNRTFIPFCIVVHIAPSEDVMTLSGLLTKTDGGTSHSYTYGNTKWADLLTAYGGNAITYDGCGNPTKYHDGKTFTWTHGRQLTAVNSNISYAYDMAGVRSSKTVDGTTYKFTTLSGLVTRQSWGSNSIEFIYDESSQPFAMRYNGTLYYYVLNVQGDVVGLLNTSGTLVATYTYDPWGKLISSTGTLASVNPLRYRGYYYDTETGFYYLQTRYYDPEIGRFINADTYATTDADNPRSTNMFAYCENDPVNRCDPTGEWFVEAALVGALVGMGRQLMMDVAYNLVAGCPLDELSSLGTYASAAFSGALSAVSGGGALMTAVNIVGSAIISEAVDSACSNEKFDVGNVVSDVISSAIQTRIANGIGSKAPTKISDIKAEAKAQGAHGTNDLRAYLKNKQQAYSSAVELFNNAFDTVRNFVKRGKA